MIKSLLRSLEILEILKENDHRFSIAEVSEKAGLPPSTVHRILQTFAEMRYVTRDENSHTYTLGPALISLGRTAAGSFKIHDASLPVLKELSASTREDTYLVIRSGDRGLVLQKQNGPNHLKVVEEFGYEMDLHCGAIRKVLLAYQPDSYIHYYMDNCLDRPDAFPQMSRKALLEELDEIRANGCSVSYGEYVHDAVGIGAPIFGPEGSIVAAIGIIAPTSRVADDKRLQLLKSEVMRCAGKLSV